MLTAAESESVFRAAVFQHLRFLYPAKDADSLVTAVSEVFDGYCPANMQANGPWSENDSLLITYGDSVTEPGRVPLQTLAEFLTTRIRDVFSAVHVLPFSPYSSDDGFAVVDYCQVDPKLGDWSDMTRLANCFRLMADLVINHVSSQSAWFQNYCENREPGATWFVEADPSVDLSEVVRPRASPLLRPTETSQGLRHVWCTFSHDQIDLDFRNPDVLIEFLKIIRRYLEHGVCILRLDAIGFLWKETGTGCIHLPQTHEVVRLLRTVVDHVAPGTILVTETNVPNHENLSYFGNRNEAHVVYNFSLAPLLVHALLTGETAHLKRWMMSMPPAPVGCTYLNFTASHDGIGMRPVEGLLTDDEQSQMVEAIQDFGGRLSTRQTPDGGERIYELNISLFDAMKGTVRGEDEWQVDRFLCSQTVMMAVEGIPAFYIHSLLATSNDEAGVEATGDNRSINRRKLNLSTLEERLADPTTVQAIVFHELKRRLAIRLRQPAFHPNATQFTLQPAAEFFAFWRQSADRRQSVFAVHNMTDRTQELRLSELNLITLDTWRDLLQDESFGDLNATVPVKPYQCMWITNSGF